jgi:hypothetical protein
VSLTRLLGVLALAEGGSLLLSELLLGQDLFSELTRNNPVSLRLGCAVAIVLGVLAIRLGRREEKEFNHPQGGTEA